MDNSLLNLSHKWDDDDFAVEYSVAPFVDINGRNTGDNIFENIHSIEEAQAVLNNRIEELNADIDRLTNHAEGFDYAIAACSGVLCGLIDSFYVSEFNFEDLKADAHKHVNKFIEKYAKWNGWDGHGSHGAKGHLKDAISFLEKKHPVDQDDAWKAANSSTRLHHLEDLAHHPTPLGLFFAVVVSFFRCAVFVDREGKWRLEVLEVEPKKLTSMWIPIVISGILRWLVYLAEEEHKERNGENLPKPICKLIRLIAYTPGIIDILKVAVNWFGHLVSDMGGSKKTAGRGMGIPGLFLSLLKEMSSLPWLKTTSLPKQVSDWYSKGKIDLRSEVAIVEYLGKLSVPVILNECVVRTLYFVKHLIAARRNAEVWADVNWTDVKPWGNRTINRMLTIATGTFTAFDFADAAIRSAARNGCNIYNPKLYTDFLLRINFVGIGRLVIAIYVDVNMGRKRGHEMQKKLALMNRCLMYDNAKTYYLHEGLYSEIANTAEAMAHLQEVAYKSAEFYVAKIDELDKQWASLAHSVSNIRRNDPDFADELLDLIN